jgi:hypothetical protein
MLASALRLSTRDFNGCKVSFVCQTKQRNLSPAAVVVHGVFRRVWLLLVPGICKCFWPSHRAVPKSQSQS